MNRIQADAPFRLPSILFILFILSQNNFPST